MCQQTARAICEFLSLTNLAETHHRHRRRRQFELGLGKLSNRHRVDDAARELADKGLTDLN